MMMNKKKPFSLHLDVDSFMPATAEEKEVISRMRPSSTFFRDGVKRLLKNKVATISLILIVLITLSSIIIPMFWPYSYDQMLGQTKGRPMDNSYNNLAPFQYGKTELKKIDKGESVFPHIFGTDAHGRDYFIRVVYGTRISLAVGFFASIIVLVIGMMIGAVAGYFGGRVDLFIMRIVDIIYSLPDMLVIILLSVVLGQVPLSASEASEPSEGIGALTPRPRKDRKLSVKIAFGICSAVEIITTLMQFGRRCLRIIHCAFAPVACADSTYSCSRRDRI